MTNINHITGEAILNTVPFFYEITGQGHPLVLVHAGIADQRMWDEQVLAFSKHYQVIRYDLRGYGKTPMVAGAFSHWQDLHDLLKLLNVDSAYLLGCSLGGTTIIDFVLEYPEMVDALIAVACVPDGYEPPAEATMSDAILKIQQEHEAAIHRGDLDKAAELEANYWLAGPSRTIDQVDVGLRTRMYEMNKIALANKVAYMDKIQSLEPSAISRLHEIHIPTLVVASDLDDPAIIHGTELLATSISGAEKVVIVGAAHFPNMERSDAFNRVVLDFLAAL